MSTSVNLAQIRAYLDEHPDTQASDAADAIAPGLGVKKRKALMSRIRVEKHKRRQADPATAGVKPADPRRGKRGKPRKTTSAPRLAPPLVPELVIPPAPPTPGAPAAMPVDPEEAAALHDMSPLYRRQWLLTQATRGVLWGDPGAQAYQSAITKVQQALVAYEEIEQQEAATKPRKTIEEVMRELAARADRLPLAMLEPIVLAYCERTKQQLTPVAA